MLGKFRCIVRNLLAVGLATVVANSATAGPITWTGWTSATIGSSGSAAGTLGAITVGFTGELSGNTQVAGGINYWVPNAPYLNAVVGNAPPASDILTSVGGSPTITYTITFSQAVQNPVLAIVSLGAPGTPRTLQFDQSFTLLSSGTGYWGGAEPDSLFQAGNILTGIEGHGAIQFNGTFTSLSWKNPTFENWSGIQVGLPEQLVGAVPAPPAVVLLGIGAVGLLRVRRRA